MTNTVTISEQHHRFLERQSERAAFMATALECRMQLTNSADVRAFADYLLTLVDEAYPKIPLYAAPAEKQEAVHANR